jgi:nitroreductase
VVSGEPIRFQPRSVNILKKTGRIELMNHRARMPLSLARLFLEPPIAPLMHDPHDSPPRFIPFPRQPDVPEEEMIRRSNVFCEGMQARRSARQFSDRPVSLDLVLNCVRSAGTAPSGANQQPWRFIIVKDPEVKRSIRQAAEEEERRFYGERAPEEWLNAIRPMGTDDHKPFLEMAPFLIVVMAISYGVGADGSRYKHYYVSESVGIACGFLIAAIHNAGLACLTHTPSPMGFLTEILDRPPNERPFLLIPVGYPADDAVVPDLCRKALKEIAIIR